MSDTLHPLHTALRTLRHSPYGPGTNTQVDHRSNCSEICRWRTVLREAPPEQPLNYMYMLQRRMPSPLRTSLDLYTHVRLPLRGAAAASCSVRRYQSASPAAPRRTHARAAGGAAVRAMDATCIYSFK